MDDKTILTRKADAAYQANSLHKGVKTTTRDNLACRLFDEDMAESTKDNNRPAEQTVTVVAEEALKPTQTTQITPHSEDATLKTGWKDKRVEKTKKIITASSDEEETEVFFEKMGEKKVTLEALHELLVDMKKTVSDTSDKVTKLDSDNNTFLKRLEKVENSIVDVQAKAQKMEEAEKRMTEKANEIEAMNKELKEATTKLQEVSQKIENVTSYAKYQDIPIVELHNQIGAMKEKDTKGCMTIAGIIRNKNENCIDLVQRFIKTLLKVQENIHIYKAFRVGGGADTAPIMFFLTNPGEKGLLFKNVSKLKGVKNVNKEYFTLRDSLPGPQMELQKKYREAVGENKRLPPNEQLQQLKHYKGELYIDKEKYQSEIQIPLGVEIVDWPMDRWTRMKAVYETDIKAGIPITNGKSHFCGFTVLIRTIQHVNFYYEVMRAMHLSARHIVMAFRLPGHFLANCDGEDDGEYGAARMVKEALKHSNITHRMLFVTRHYEGTHIGQSRFESYLRAARSAIIHHSDNQFAGTVDVPWSEEYCIYTEPIPAKDGQPRKRGGFFGQVRGRGRGRGRHRNDSESQNTVWDPYQSQGSWGDGGFDEAGFPLNETQ